jgi:lipoyl(octanoyl) transferase
LIEVRDLGLIDYDQAHEVQLETVASVLEKKSPEIILVCSHPSVVTLGRASKSEDLIGWDGKLVEISRGGRATYHGPGQVIAYPILDLSREDRKNLKPRDLHAYLRILEATIVSSLEAMGISAQGKPDSIETETAGANATGVWVGSKKIASIGIGVRKWVSFHGLAVNVSRDPLAFRGINPCGFSQNTMISLEDLMIEANQDTTDLQARFQTQLIKDLKRNLNPV